MSKPVETVAKKLPEREQELLEETLREPDSNKNPS